MMIRARQLIELHLSDAWAVAKPRPGFRPKASYVLRKGEFLSGREVAALKPNEEVFVEGKRSRVIEIEVRGNEVTLYYVKGKKSYGAELSLVMQKSDSTTPVQAPVRIEYERVTEKRRELGRLTHGMRNAMKELAKKKVCPACGFSVPTYPGRYPNKCTECGAEW